VTDALRSQFERCRPWIAEALAVDAEATPDELLEEVLSGRAQLWPGEDCCLITQCVDHPDGRTIHTWCGAGKLSGMMALRPGIEAWGRSMGAVWGTIESRKGWDRLFAPHGFYRDGDVLRKAL
jgi:hypothetical protein